MDRDRQHIVTTRVEHSATLKHCETLAKRGHEITWLGAHTYVVDFHFEVIDLSGRGHDVRRYCLALDESDRLQLAGYEFHHIEREWRVAQIL